MKTRQQAITYGLTFPHTYVESPFKDPNWELVRVKGSKKAFLWVYEKDGYINLNIKVDPEWREFWREAYDAVIPGYHQNKKYWNTIILDGTIPEKDIKKMIKESYDIITDSPTKRIYEAVKQIPKGHVATYGQVAAMAGNPKMSRAVGNALHKNPDPENIPCFRVVNAKGELAGAFAFGGEGNQAKLLEEDGVVVVDGKVDLDGKIKLIAERKISPRSWRCRIVCGGVLTARKSIALPGCNINNPTLTEADLKNLSLAKQYQVTDVMLPFVRNKEDLIILREALKQNNSEDIRIFAKIENMTGVEHLEELLPYCDYIVIARGDLGNVMPLSKLPKVQAYIAKVCKEHNKNFMVVTQMLDSMIRNPYPTRAEVNDIYHAVHQGANALMLTGETAHGRYPVEAMKMLVETANGSLEEL